MNPWPVACQAPLSAGFPRQKYWSGLPFPSRGDLPNLGTKPASLAWEADSLLLSQWEAQPCGSEDGIRRLSQLESCASPVV